MLKYLLGLIAKAGDSSYFVAQAAHFLAGMGACTALLAFSPKHYGWAIFTSVLFWVYAIGKEIWFDPKYEVNAPFKWGGAIDLVFLLGGNITAWVIYALTRS